jgi:lysophospholipase L1-like esterase
VAHDVGILAGDGGHREAANLYAGGKTQTRPTGAFGTNKDDPKLYEFAAVEREIAKAKNVPLNDLHKSFVEYWKKNNPDDKVNGILTYDGNHWNDAGH